MTCPFTAHHCVEIRDRRRVGPGRCFTPGWDDELGVVDVLLHAVFVLDGVCEPVRRDHLDCVAVAQGCFILFLLTRVKLCR